MLLANANKIEPYQRQLLLVFKQAAENSPDLNETQKLAIERHLQEVVNIWTNPDFVNERKLT